MYKKYMFYLFSLFASMGSLSAQVNYTSSFDRNKLIIDTISDGNGTVYNSLQFQNLYNEGEPGYPELPVKYITISVPTNVNEFEIVIENLQTETICLDNRLYPGQYPVPTLIGYKPKGFMVPNEAVYNSITQFPQRRVSITENGFLDGDKHLLTIAIYPVTYYPVLGKIEFSNHLSLKIIPCTTFSRKTRTIVQRISRNNVDNLDDEMIRYLKSVVVNPEDVEKNVSNNSLKLKLQSSVRTISLPYYEYCVITSRKLSHSFKRLVAWKREKGLNAGIICVEDILSNNDILGDSKSNLYDSAAKIRDYLQLAFENGKTKYVLFGGNDRVLPIRYGTGGNNNWGWGNDTIAGKIPTDLYFSDLNTNWNTDADEYLGEPSEEIMDYLPELYVGRILCTTPEEVERYITKLLKYEQNPGNGDFSYLKKAFYSQEDEMQKLREANIIALDMQSIFPQYSIVEEYPTYDDINPTYPTGNIVIDSINQNRSAFLSWFGHGNPGGIGVRSNGNSQNKLYGILALQEDTWYHEMETANGLNNLTNMDYPAIAYSIACTVIPFDIVNQYKVKYNVGESFTVGGLYGGPAFIGNTRHGYVYSSYKLQKSFDDCIKKGHFKIGVAEALSKGDYKGMNKHWMALTNNLIGCPEFEMWTDTPAYFSDLTAIFSSSSVAVNTSGLDSVIISVRGLFGSDYIAKQTVTNQSSVNFTGLPKNTTITVNKHNYIPKIFPLYAQNENITGFSYIHASDAYFGKNVIPTKAQGYLTVKSGAEVIVEKSGMVYLESGFEVEKGGVFEVK